MGFRAHNIGDAEPLLALVKGLHHVQHDHVAADACGAAAGKIYAIAFLGFVDDDQKLRSWPVSYLRRWRDIGSRHEQHNATKRYAATAGRRSTSGAKIRVYQADDVLDDFIGSRPAPAVGQDRIDCGRIA